MTRVKYNIIANYLGQVWTGFMALAFIPIYIEYLGMEAYGLIGLFAVIQSLLMLLDAGMTPTLNREMARFTAGEHSTQSIRELLRSLEVICYGLALVIVVCLWVASAHLATDWLKADHLPTEVVANALVIMAFVIGMRLCEGIYRGSLYGLEQQVWYNAIYSLLTTLRYGGALMILRWVSASIEAFFIWQAVISLLTVLVFSVRVHRTLPKAFSRVKFSYSALARVWKFASGMMSITFLTMLLLQMDKVLLSKLLSLDEFGYYALAATAASTIYMIIVPVTQAVYPRIVNLASRGDQAELITVYHQTSQLVMVLIAPAAMLLCFFADGVVFMWSGNPNLVLNTAPLLSILVVGCFLNGLSYLPYQIQIAHGWISLLIKANVLIVLVLIPLIYLVAPKYGAEGAAWIWLGLNAGYVLITTHFMHRRLLQNEKWSWYFDDVCLPTFGAISVMFLAQLTQPQDYQDRLYWFLFLLFTGLFAMLASALLAPEVRLRLILYVFRKIT
jgi:O-antigen/teichoic acid export membrane protein